MIIPLLSRRLGRVAAGILLRLLADKKPHTVAVTGGTTVAAMAENIYGKEPEATIVPAVVGWGIIAPGQYDCYGSCTQIEDQVPSALRAR